MSGTPRVFKSLDSWFDHYSVKAESGCFNFSGALDRKGYGKIGHKGKTCVASRLAYEKAVGQIPEGMNVCHKCDNPQCINPDHLFLGTQKANIHDMLAKGRSMRSRKSRCAHGHSLRVGKKQNYCPICRIEYKKRWRANRRLAGLPHV